MANRRNRQSIVGRFAAALSGRAVKLLVELELQYDGKNNGDLTITRAKMRPRGFVSADQLSKARDELINAGWILVARQGGRHIPTLYAFSYRAVDRCNGKLDVSPGPPTHLWKPDQAQWREPRGAAKGPRRGYKPAKSLTRKTDQCDPQHGPPLTRTTEQAH